MMKLFNNKKDIGKRGVKITQDVLGIIEGNSTMTESELKEIRNIIMEQVKKKYAIVLVGGVK
jgi:hypothetical protein